MPTCTSPANPDPKPHGEDDKSQKRHIGWMKLESETNAPKQWESAAPDGTDLCCMTAELVQDGASFCRYLSIPASYRCDIYMQILYICANLSISVVVKKLFFSQRKGKVLLPCYSPMASKCQVPGRCSK